MILSEMSRVCLGNEKKKCFFMGVVFWLISYSFPQQGVFLPCCDHIITAEYADFGSYL